MFYIRSSQRITKKARKLRFFTTTVYKVPLSTDASFRMKNTDVTACDGVASKLCFVLGKYSVSIPPKPNTFTSSFH